LGTYLAGLRAFPPSARDLHGGSGADLMTLGPGAAGAAETPHRSHVIT